jgi:SSS family solute:Na+ symporter
MNSGLLILGATVIGSLLLGLLARRGRDMDLEQWSVGGRSFGSLLIFLLMAGEIYTTFSFLGCSGYAYGKGAAAYYILVYITLAQVLGYWLAPAIWRYAQAERLYSQPHFFVRKYDSPALGLLVAIVDVVALIPYLMLQLKGLGIIVSTTSYDAISPTVAILIGAAVVAIYVTASGVRGAAWNAVVKDAMILGVVVFLGIYLPFHYYGGYTPMFQAIEAAKPGFLAFPARGNSVVWFQSTVLLTVLGAFMWPHLFCAAYTAKDERSFRRNSIVLPLYSLLLLFVCFVGFCAILQVPGLQGADIDLALLKLSVQSFDPWFVGVIGAAGLMTALVSGSVLLTSAATILASDIYRGVIRPGASDANVTIMARIMVPVVMLVAVAFALAGGSTIVALLLMGYNLVTQLFPAAALSFLHRNPATKQGAFCGVLAGVVTVAVITVTKSTIGDILPFLPESLQDLNVGFAALIVNLGVMALVSLVTRKAPVLAPSGT